MNGAGGLLVVRFFSIDADGELRARTQPADELRQVLGRALGVGVLGRLVAVDDEPEQLGGLAGVGLVVGLELLAGQLDQLGDERVVLAEPLLALELGPLAVAGVGQEVVPLGGELLAGCRRRRRR